MLLLHVPKQYMEREAAAIHERKKRAREKIIHSALTFTCEAAGQQHWKGNVFISFFLYILNVGYFCVSLRMALFYLKFICFLFVIWHTHTHSMARSLFLSVSLAVGRVPRYMWCNSNCSIVSVIIFINIISNVFLSLSLPLRSPANAYAFEDSEFWFALLFRYFHLFNHI